MKKKFIGSIYEAHLLPYKSRQYEKNICEVFKMSDLNGIPQGLGMALSRSEKAMHTFALLNENEKKRLIDLSRSVRSKSEMNRLVGKLEKGKNQLF